MYQLTKMKHFKERLECWLFQDKFSEIIYGIGMTVISFLCFYEATLDNWESRMSKITLF